MTTPNELTKLYDATSRILAELVASDVRIEGAINWGNLYCACVVACLNNDGETWNEVHINEASPAAYKLSQYVSGKLAEAGFPDVVVKTEW